MTKRIMRSFKMDEISAVDRPAQAHAKVVLMKRDFNASERRHDASTGAAMPDGSFPIENAEDLANARRLVGHAKDPAAARAHIATRAKALGLAKLDGLIEEYLGHEDKEMELTLNKEDLQKAVDAAVIGLRKEFEGKLKDSAEKLAKAQEDAIMAGMTDAERAYYTTLKAKEPDDFKEKDEKPGKEDAGDGGNPPGKKTKKVAFAEMSSAERKIEMAKALDATIPDYVRKQLEEAADLKKRLALLEDDRAVASFAKRATGLGIEGHGETLRKAYGGAPMANAAAVEKLESLIKGLTEQIRTGKVFAEFGASQSGAGATAADDMDALANVYREGQIKIGKQCSKEQAFTKIYTDPAHAELKSRYDAEDMKKRMRAA